MHYYLRFLYGYAILQAILVRFLRFGEHAYLKVRWVAYISFYSIKKQKQYSFITLNRPFIFFGNY